MTPATFGPMVGINRQFWSSSRPRRPRSYRCRASSGPRRPSPSRL